VASGFSRKVERAILIQPIQVTVWQFARRRAVLVRRVEKARARAVIRDRDVIECMTWLDF
jgi:hypothetical protein